MADQTQRYRSPPAAGSSREIEAWALTEAALRMRTAAESGDREAILVTVRLNWRLWTFFQAELLGPECSLPEPLRSNLVSLAAFIDRQTVEILAQPDPSKLDVLVSINRDLAMGLMTNPPEAEVAAPSASAQEAGGINLSA